MSKKSSKSRTKKAVVDQKSPAVVSQPHPAWVEYKKSTTPVVDVKVAAANDKPEPKTQNEVGAARSEGIRLYKLSGKPNRDQFRKVFGPRGDKLTWTERAKVAGLASAEEAAAQFQNLLAKAGK